MSGRGSLALTTAALVAGIALLGCGGGSSSGTGGKGGASGTGGKGGASATGGKGGASATGATGGSSAGTGGQTASGSGGSNAGGTDAGATGGASTGTDAGVAGADLGKACAAAADCGGGLICLLPTDKLIFGQGGPAHGYCTLACTDDATDGAKCSAMSGTCVDLRVREADPPQGYCLQNCTIGADGVGTKCHTRPDVACTSLSGDPDAGVVPDVCVPTCSQDIDCPTNRKCDDLLAVCVDTKTAGDATGTHCTFDSTGTMPDTCAGLCLPLGDGTNVFASYCTRRCVFGALNGCNYVEKASPLTTGGPHAICVIADDTAGIGDQGFCVQQCDTADQCSDKADRGAVCDTSVPELGHGFCNWPGPAGNVDAGTGG